MLRDVGLAGIGARGAAMVSAAVYGDLVSVYPPQAAI